MKLWLKVFVILGAIVFLVSFGCTRAHATVQLQIINQGQGPAATNSGGPLYSINQNWWYNSGNGAGYWVNRGSDGGTWVSGLLSANQGSALYNLNCDIPAGQNGVGQYTSAEYQLLVYSTNGTVYLSSWSAPVQDGMNAVVYVSIQGGLPCVSNVTFHVQNANASPMAYWQSADGASGIFNVESYLYLLPGASGVSVQPWPCSEVSRVRLYQIVDNGAIYNFIQDLGTNGIPTGWASPGQGTLPDDTLLQPGITPGAQNGTSGSSSTNLPSGPNNYVTNPVVQVQQPPLFQYNPTNSGVTGSNSAILWTPDTYTNPATAVQEMGNALQDSQTKAAAAAQAAANAAQAGVSNIVGAIDGISGGMSNALSNVGPGISNALAHAFGTNITVGGGTNEYDLTLTNYAYESTLAGLSNLLGTASLSNIDQNGSAALGSGIMGVVMSNYNNYLPGYRTNGDALFAAGSGAETNYDQSGKMDELATAPSIQPDSQAAPNMMVLQFCGTDIDLNPVDIFPDVATASHLGFTIVAEIAFLFFAGRLFWECVRAKGATQQGAVPNLMALGGGEILGIGGEVGGNFLGVMTALLIPAMFIGLFYGVLAYVFSVIGFSISDAFNISAFQSTLGEIGLYLLGAYIPVNVLFTLACLSVTMQFTMAKFYNIACNCARYLWGG